VLLDKVAMNLYEGEILVVSGASGTGKSTLLRALALLQPFDEGILYFRGSPVAANGAKEWRSKVLYVRQVGGQGMSAKLVDRVCPPSWWTGPEGYPKRHVKQIMPVGSPVSSTP
jgi:ABC-type iron transport system FetAB ATPase subunit